MNKEQLRQFALDTVRANERKIYDYMSSVYPIGSEIHVNVADGWRFTGASIQGTDDGQGKYLLVRWRREVLT